MWKSMALELDFTDKAIPTLLMLLNHILVPEPFMAVEATGVVHPRYKNSYLISFHSIHHEDA